LQRSAHPSPFWALAGEFRYHPLVSAEFLAERLVGRPAPVVRECVAAMLEKRERQAAMVCGTISHYSVIAQLGGASMGFV
jgi:hypothetical protein